MGNCKLVALLFLALIVASYQNVVDYGNTLIKWERRELTCEASPDGKNPGACTLFRRHETTGTPANCQFMNGRDRVGCDIDCQGADRDSVISKSPNNNHRCVRFYTYDSLLDEASKKWSIWRSDECLLQKISLEVHCGFP
uniref:Secreted protein n=1 Tax=Panagrellus redivivus TaxID=6233 RepID=A0A7E4VQZ2_PANRE